jgi:hypothetical protein
MVGGWHGQLVARVPKEQKGKQQPRIFSIMINPFLLRALAMFASSTHECWGIPLCSGSREAEGQVEGRAFFCYFSLPAKEK